MAAVSGVAPSQTARTIGGGHRLFDHVGQRHLAGGSRIGYRLEKLSGRCDSGCRMKHSLKFPSLMDRNNFTDIYPGSILPNVGSPLHKMVDHLANYHGRMLPLINWNLPTKLLKLASRCRYVGPKLTIERNRVD